MIEILNYSKESWQNFIIVLFFMGYLLILIDSAFKSFKPVVFNYITTKDTEKEGEK